MIVDLAAEGEQPGSTRGEIIASWVWTKLTRDLKAARITPVLVTDRNRFVEQIEAFMTDLAGEMVDRDESGCRLLDTIGSEIVIEACERVFGTRGLDLGQAISVSLLIPTAIRHRGNVPVRFTHRAFQEYFLALYLERTGEPIWAYPESVQRIYRELAA